MFIPQARNPSYSRESRPASRPQARRSPDTIDMNTLVWPPPSQPRPSSATPRTGYQSSHRVESHDRDHTTMSSSLQLRRPSNNQGIGIQTSSTSRSSPHEHQDSYKPQQPIASSSRATAPPPNPQYRISTPPPREPIVTSSIRRIPRFKLDENSPLESGLPKRRLKDIRPPTPGLALLNMNRHEPLMPPGVNVHSPIRSQYYSSGYSPTFPPTTPPSTTPGSHHVPQPFFEPLGFSGESSIQSPILSDRDRWNPTKQEYLSPVLEDGKLLHYCHVPSYLTPGGYLERGWTDEFRRKIAAEQSRSHSSRTPNDISYAYNLPSPMLLQVRDNQLQRSHSYSSSSSSNMTSSPSHSSDGPIPTRKGYWNRRGDTIGDMGHVRRAPKSQMYPPDLAHYPKYALMNENGQLTLPMTEEDRVYVWRSYTN